MKKIVTLLMALVLMLGVSGCSNSDSNKSNNGKKDTSSSVKIKTVKDFTEFDGLIKYYTIGDKKISVPETVGEYTNYLSQIGTVTLNETGKDPSEVDLDAKGISSMAAYLKVETDDGDEAHFYVRYTNKTNKSIKVSEAPVTYIEVRYDAYAEVEYDRAFNNIKVVTSAGTLPLDNKMKFNKVRKILGEPYQETDGRFNYADDNGYKYMFDCCNENREGIFRGFSIEYPSK